MSNFKDYHLYIGQEALVNGIRRIFEGIQVNGNNQLFVYLRGLQGYWMQSNDDFKLLLRPLESMTEEEAAELADIVITRQDSVKWKVEKRLTKTKDGSPGVFAFWNIDRKHRGYALSMTIDERGEIEIYDGTDIGLYMRQHEATRWLLSKGFDLFGGIQAGWALDKTKL